MKIVIYGLLLVSCIGACSGQTNASCKEAQSFIAKTQMKMVADCNSKMRFKNGKENLCLALCGSRCGDCKTRWVIGADGQIDPVGVLNFVEKYLPPSVHEWGRELVMSCMPTTVDLDPEERTCKSYAPMAKCTIDIFSKMCAGPGSTK